MTPDEVLALLRDFARKSLQIEQLEGALAQASARIQQLEAALAQTPPPAPSTT